MVVAFGEQQFGPRLCHRRRPGAARRARRAVLGALQELVAARKLAGPCADRRGGQVIAGWTERAHPAWVKQRLGTLDQRERLGALLGDLQQHAVDEEEQMLGKRRDVRELERLLELRPRAGPVAQAKQRLALAHTCE